MNVLKDELIETLEYLSLLIDIELSDDVEVDITHHKLLIEVRNKINNLARAVIKKQINKIRESL